MEIMVTSDGKKGNVTENTPFEMEMMPPMHCVRNEHRRKRYWSEVYFRPSSFSAKSISDKVHQRRK
jgi:hypothetical protein